MNDISNNNITYNHISYNTAKALLIFSCTCLIFFVGLSIWILTDLSNNIKITSVEIDDTKDSQEYNFRIKALNKFENNGTNLDKINFDALNLARGEYRYQPVKPYDPRINPVPQVNNTVSPSFNIPPQSINSSLLLSPEKLLSMNGSFQTPKSGQSIRTDSLSSTNSIESNLTLSPGEIGMLSGNQLKQANRNDVNFSNGSYNLVTIAKYLNNIGFDKNYIRKKLSDCIANQNCGGKYNNIDNLNRSTKTINYILSKLPPVPDSLSTNSSFQTASSGSYLTPNEGVQPWIRQSSTQNSGQFFGSLE